jgi:ubiquinone/menaquinone biosynthesis C-methylase UbiE
MDPALQRRVQRYGWDKAALFYETFWSRQLVPAQELLLELADLGPGEKILDIACGTGLVSFRARELVGATGTVIGTDISEKMIEHCEAKTRQLGLNNISFKRMEAEELSLDPSTFNKALCALGLMYVPDPIRAIKEMRRMLKPGGACISAVWGRRDRCGWSELFDIVDQYVASDVCPMFFNLGNPDMLLLSFKAAGFEKVRTETISTILQFENEAEACGAAFAGGPVALVYHKFDERIKEKVHQEYLASIASYKNHDAYEIPGEFVVAKGTKGND